MMLNSVRNMVLNLIIQVATLEFVSVETIVNETARVNKKYTGNISDTVMNYLLVTKKELEQVKNYLAL